MKKFVIYYDKGNEKHVAEVKRAGDMIRDAAFRNGFESRAKHIDDTEGPKSRASIRAGKSIRLPRYFLDVPKSNKRNNGGLVWLRGYLEADEPNKSKSKPKSDAEKTAEKIAAGAIETPYVPTNKLVSGTTTAEEAGLPAPEPVAPRPALKRKWRYQKLSNDVFLLVLRPDARPNELHEHPSVQAMQNHLGTVRMTDDRITGMPAGHVSEPGAWRGFYDMKGWRFRIMHVYAAPRFFALVCDTVDGWHDGDEVQDFIIRQVNDFPVF